MAKGRPKKTAEREEVVNNDSSMIQQGMGLVVQQLSSLTSTITTQQESLNSLTSILKSQSEGFAGLLNGVGSHNNNTSGGMDYGNSSIDNSVPANNSSPLDDLMDDLEDSNEEVLVIEDGDDDECVSAMNQLFESNNEAPKYGPSINEKISESFKRIVQQQLKKEEGDKLRETYLVPENCKDLSVPHVNPQIWMHLNQNGRSAEGKLQFIQSHLSRSLIAQAQIAAKIFTLGKEKKLSKDDVTKLLKPLMDAATSIGVVNKDFNLKRRANLKQFNPQIGNMCKSSIPITEFLFGDNFEADLKTANTAASLARPKTNPRGTRFKPYQRGGRNSSIIQDSNNSTGIFGGRGQRGASHQGNRGNFRGRPSSAPPYRRT